MDQELTGAAQSSESRLYTFSQESKDHLRKFRLGTSRSNDPQAVICMYVSAVVQTQPAPREPALPMSPDTLPREYQPHGAQTGGGLADRPRAPTDMIDKRTHEVKQDEEKIVYKSLEEIGDELPDNSPRFVLLSYPLTLVRRANLHPPRARPGPFSTSTYSRPHSRPVAFPYPMSCCTTSPSRPTTS